MRSKVQVKGHPLHPILIPFPLAFLVGAFAADVAGTLVDAPGLWITAWHLAAASVAMGLVAAVPGVIDWLYVVPARSSGKRGATRHEVRAGPAGEPIATHRVREEGARCACWSRRCPGDAPR